MAGQKRSTKDCVALEQEVWEEMEARPGDREIPGKERTCRRQVARGLPAPQNRGFQGPGSGRLLPTWAAQY